jgi:16S rRNA (adenine1518-N6/adenine1519-N6)-dimethyltransferase
MQTKKFLGQHFLIDQFIIQHIIDELIITSDKHILEIGPGAGALTYPLLKTEAFKIVAVEVDDDLIEKYKLIQDKDSRFEIIHKSILDIHINTVININDSEKWIIVGNLPYNITTPILKKLIEWKASYKKAVIMIQEEVAQKLIKKRGKDYTPLSLLIQFHFDIVLHNKVLPQSFEPPPRVDSRILSLIPKKSFEVLNEEHFWKWIYLLFMQPRRTIANNVKGTPFYDKLSEDIKRKRAQELELKDFINIWNSLL